MYTGLIFSNEPLFYSILMLSCLGIAILIFILLFFITAGYGRHVKKLWGPCINNRLAWFVMELPTVVIFTLCFIFSDKWLSPVHIAFLIIWSFHYVHRVFIYPFRIRAGKKITISVILMGLLFNFTNTYIQARWLFTLSDSLYSIKLLFPISNADYSISWLYSPQFLIGTLLFIIGFIINKQSDHILRNLRNPGEINGYKIPRGGLYKLISCPNYLGEIIEWLGWALLTWSIAGLYFVFWTAANLLPRAISHHKWYKENFEDYPENRKALIPFLL